MPGAGLGRAVGFLGEDGGWYAFCHVIGRKMQCSAGRFRKTGMKRSCVTYLGNVEKAM